MSIQSRVVDPPSFSESIENSSEHDHAIPVLPTYPGRPTRPLVERRYTLGKASKPWLTLVLPSKANKPDALPYFFGHAPIKGRVELDLPKPEFFLGFELKLCGYVRVVRPTFTGVQVIKFWDTSYTLWEANVPQNRSFTDRLRRREGEALEGRHSFEFSIELPPTCEVKNGPGPEVARYSLPPFFLENSARVRVRYGFVLSVERGRMSTDDQISKTFVWQPAIQPPAMSSARKLAYSNGSSDFPNAAQDPEGWLTMEPISISGVLFGQRNIQVNYSLSLAKPLSYTRGSVIPLSIVISSEDQQALDLLSSPASISVKLICNMHSNSEEKMETKYVKDLHTTEQLSLYTEFRATQSAVWWKTQVSEEVQPEGVRLRGEIHVGPQLCPGFKLLNCRVFYTVTLFAPVVIGFELSAESVRGANPERLLLKSQEVEIATMYGGDGVRPIPKTPPAYDQGEPWPTVLGNPFSSFV